jgi:hypothetical protein
MQLDPSVLCKAWIKLKKGKIIKIVKNDKKKSIRVCFCLLMHARACPYLFMICLCQPVMCLHVSCLIMFLLYIHLVTCWFLLIMCVVLCLRYEKMNRIHIRAWHGTYIHDIFRYVISCRVVSPFYCALTQRHKFRPLHIHVHWTYFVLIG